LAARAKNLVKGLDVLTMQTKTDALATCEVLRSSIQKSCGGVCFEARSFGKSVAALSPIPVVRSAGSRSDAWTTQVPTLRGLTDG